MFIFKHSCFHTLQPNYSVAHQHTKIKILFQLQVQLYSPTMKDVSNLISE
jgi:hypothetical protein